MSSRTLFLVCAVAAVVLAAGTAMMRWWICDDAFISFRYADQLVHGNGLVYNVGERVEGYTNLLWTLWIAAGVALGVSPETWSAFWGIGCYAATVALLAYCGWSIARAASARIALPIAALLAAAHVHWTHFATSGLETSAFTLLAFVGYFFVCPPEGRVSRLSEPRRLAVAGAVFALASLTRPDGVLFALVCGVWLLAGRNVRGAVVFGLAFLAIWLPPTVWRVAYYGDFFPNTYYAKSAGLSWWSQGFFYTRLYFIRYWPLLLALPTFALATSPRRAAALELSLAVVYATYVTRVGGDFMFGRLLVPITPYLVLLVQRGLDAALTSRVTHVSVTITLVLAMMYMPPVVDRFPGNQGIVDERDVYTSFLHSWAERMDHQGQVLGRYFDGLPVRVCFFGTEARWIYRSRVHTAIECDTGLTDAWIAHRPLEKHGRIGHEKTVPISYLVQRRVHFINPGVTRRLDLDRYYPDIRVDLGGVSTRLITWDPPVVDELRRRGATIPDLPGRIDATIHALPGLSDAEVRDEWERLRRIYFDHVADPVREAPFRARLEPK